MIMVSVLSPGGILAWLLVGLIAGALAGLLTRGRGFGCLGDIVVGLVGSFLGGFLVSFFLKGGRVFHFWGSVGVALIGALVLLGLLRLVRGP